MALAIPSLIALLSAPIAAWAAQTAKVDADRAAATDGNNAFAIDLYSRLRSHPGNLFFSPESISTALAMAYAGAHGGTAAEMAKTLHFTLPPERLHPAMGALLADLNATHPGYQLSVANALWAEQSYKFLDSYLKLTQTSYGAGLQKVDFRNAAEAARKTINEWVEQKTHDKIKDLMPPGSVDARSRLVLTNAIYFKGDWAKKFDKAETKEEDFHFSASRTVKAPLMHREGSFQYFSGGAFQALAIPYQSDELSMVVVLPNEIGGLPALEQSMSAQALQQWISQMHSVSNVILTLPRFTMTRQFELGETLAAMGMKQAFDGGADFSAMDGSRDLYISAVVHKAFVDVNEEGTEAAAATGVTMRAATAMRPQPPVVFRADHPFVFLIRDNRSGSILFMGRVDDPTK